LSGCGLGAQTFLESIYKNFSYLKGRIKMSKFVIAALIVLVGCVVSIPAYAQAKDYDCQDLRLLFQASLDIRWPPTPPPAFPPFAYGWKGIVRGFLGKTPVSGILYYAVPDVLPPPPTKRVGQTGHESGRVVIDLDGVGKFVSLNSADVFQLSPQIPDPLAFGHFSATFKIDPDYSFSPFISPSGAIGNLSLSGLFLINSDNLADLGIWNAEINGKVCIPR
jgi:hypothetical protein